MFSVRPFVALGLMGLLAGAGISGNDANAQQIYRIVGPDGRVTFTDKAPLESTKAAPAPAVPLAGGTGAGGTGAGGNLPFELRQVASRYPVTFYTGTGCGPCISGRALLARRGIPFTEKTVNSNDDIEALKRLSGAPSLPLLTIGGQQLKGFSEIEWVEFLDAAGYPKTSQLPPSYTPAPATPLVAVQAPQAPAPRAAEAPAVPPPPASVQVAPDNPAGIRF
jgi:glutaredoxin